MKKIRYIIVFFVITMLYGCNKEKTIEKFDHDIYEWGGVGYMAESYSDCEDSIVLLKDYDSYQEYVNSLTDGISNKELSADLLGYEGTFFDENMLIVIIHWESTGSSTVSLHDIVYEQSEVEVVLKSVYPPDGHDEMVKDYGIIIRIPRDEKYDTIDYRVIEEHEKKWYEFGS